MNEVDFMELLKNCHLCPHNCGVNRYKQKGYCKAGNRIKLAYYSLHMWEEPVISGKNGSGTIFFSNCKAVANSCVLSGASAKPINSFFIP